MKKIPHEGADAVKASIAYVICNIVQHGMIFLVTPIFTRLLTKEQYGQYSVYMSWSGIIAILITLNLHSGSFSRAMVKFEDDKEKYISSVQGVCVVLSALFLIIYLPFAEAWNKLYELPTALMIIMVLENLLHNSLFMWYGKNMFEFKYKGNIIVTLMQTGLSVLLAIILVIGLEQKGYARIIGYSAITILFGLVCFVYNFIKGKRFFNKEYWGYALKFNLPLIAYYLSQVVFNQSDRIMISHITGKSDTAMYDLAYSLGVIMTFILNAVNNSYVPWFYKKIKQDRAEENRSVSCYIAVIFALALLCAIWFAPELILLLGGKEYASAVWVVAPVAISTFLLFYSQLLINVEFYYEKKSMLVWASIISAAINVILNAWAIPALGFVSAGYTTLVSYLFFTFLNFIGMKKILKRQSVEDNMYNYKALLGIFFAFVIISYGGVLLYRLLPVRIAITLIVLILLIANKNKFLNVLKKIKD